LGYITDPEPTEDIAFFTPGLQCQYQYKLSPNGT